MLHILLLIIKIIGIILLVILGIALLVTAVLLFVPVRYKVFAQSDGKWEEANVRVHFSWFLHLISGHVSYKEKAVSWQCRILWKKVNNPKDIPKEEKTEVPKKAIEPPMREVKKEEPVLTKEPSQPKEETKNTDKDISQDVPQDEKEQKEKQSVFQKIKYTFQNICAKIKLFLERKEKIVDFIGDEVHKNALRRVKKEVFRLLRFLKPKKFKMYLHYGLDDPCTTGKILAGLSVFYPFYGNDVEIYPDFERKILAGNLEIKGHIRGGYAAIILWNLLWDKNIRLTYRHIKEFKF